MTNSKVTSERSRMTPFGSCRYLGRAREARPLGVRGRVRRLPRPRSICGTLLVSLDDSRGVQGKTTVDCKGGPPGDRIHLRGPDLERTKGNRWTAFGLGSVDE